MQVVVERHKAVHHPSQVLLVVTNLQQQRVVVIQNLHLKVEVEVVARNKSPNKKKLVEVL